MIVVPYLLHGEPKLRLIAEEGKTITNGRDSFKMIDVDTLCGWLEINDTQTTTIMVVMK